MSARFLIAILLISAGPAIAADQIVALSPIEKERLLDAAADRNARLIGEPTIDGVSRRPHGEVGLFVGSHGARGVFGSTVMPVGESATVGLAFELSRLGRFPY